jgi:hypothetical protein
MPGETFGSILGAIYRRRITVLLVLAGALGGGIIYLQKVGADYLARALVMLPQRPPTLSLSSEGANVPDGPLLPALSDELNIGAMGMLSGGAVHERMLAKHPELDLRAMRKNLRGNLDRYGNLEILSYAPDGERAAVYANDFADCFQQEMQAVTEGSMRHSLETFRAEEPGAMALYRDLHQGLVQYLGSIGSVDVNDEMQRLLEDRRRLEDQLLALDLERVKSEAERPVIEQALAERPDFQLTRVTYSRNPAYEQAMSKTRELSTQLALALIEFRESHPEIVRLRKELEIVRQDAVNLLTEQMVLQSQAETQDDLGMRLTTRLADLDIAAASRDSQRTVLEANNAELDRRLAEIPSYLSEIALRQAEMANARMIWERISQRRAELEFHLRNGVHFTIMTPGMRAKPEAAKEVPTTAGLMLFCIIAGLSGGLMLAVVQELLARMRASRPY